MTIFYITLLLVYLFSLFARCISNKKSKRASLFFAIIATSILVLVSGLRVNIGDTSMYIHSYQVIGPGYDAKGVYEPGFILFFKLLKLISKDPQFMLIVTSLIINVCIMFTLWKYSNNYYFEIATFLYISSGYILVTMNGIRQCLAAALIFACTPILLKGKTKLYIIIVIIACTLHSSALVMIPIYFISKMKPWSKFSFFLVACTIFAMVLYQPLISVAAGILGGKIADYSTSTEGGASLIRVVIYFVPVVLSYLKREELNNGWDKINIFANISLISSLIMLFSSINWVFSRFTLYLEPYTFILMAYMVKNCFRGSEKRLIYYSLVICYTLFFFVECPANLNNVPYKTNFNVMKFLY